jgi:hypothetical protein
METVKYKKLQAGSSRYGSCEICKCNVETTYLRREKNKPMVFGNLECLKKVGG